MTTPHVGFDYSLFYAWSYAQLFAIKTLPRQEPEWQGAMNAYPHLTNDMATLAQEARLTAVAQAIAAQPVPPTTATPQEWQRHADALLAILQQRDLGRERRFSAEQIEKLNRYLDANELLVQCLKVATVTDRQAILKGILKPPVVDAVETPVTEKPAKQAGKPWWKFW